MATYVYACTDCGEQVEKSAPIGTAQRMQACPVCGGLARMVLGDGMYIAAAATPNKRQSVVEADARESRWDKDMPAYKRMRNKGMQPPQVDGAAKLEDRAGDQLDIELARPSLNGVSRERFVEAKEVAAEAERAARGHA